MSDEAVDLVIFGGTGDLAWRKLVPALFMADRHGRLPADIRITALGRQPWSPADYRAFLTQHSTTSLPPSDKSHWGRFLERLDYATLDATDANAYGALQARLQPDATRVYYLATAPALFATICQHLNAAALITPTSRVVLEKPLGHDLPSAQAINDAVAQHFAEHQIYRIDHYLGKETVQNLMVLRFGNAIFEPLWRAPHIRSVQITVA